MLSDAQVKAVFDYQRSLGGSLIDILVKLGMMTKSRLDAVLATAQRGGDVAAAAGTRKDYSLKQGELSHDELKIHHRILDKIPPELTESFLLVVFFPARKLDSRRLIIGHGEALPDDVRDRVRSTLGVEIYTLRLQVGAAGRFLAEYFGRRGNPVPTKVVEAASSP